MITCRVEGERLTVSSKPDKQFSSIKTLSRPVSKRAGIAKHITHHMVFSNVSGKRSFNCDMEDRKVIVLFNRWCRDMKVK